MENSNTYCISSSDKKACAERTMQYMLRNYARDMNITIDEAFLRFSASSTYQVLFDFETAVWKEGPDYLRSLFDRALSQQN